MTALKTTAKMFAVHVLEAVGLRRLIRQRLGRPLSHLTGDTAERFARIYHEGVWRHGQAETPGSGAGSTLDATSALRARLPGLLTQIGARRLVDIGCGDLTWLRETPIPCGYVGMDIVPTIIDENRRIRPDLEFVPGDVIHEELPDGDVVLCREILFHLSFADARATLRNILSKPRRYILATTDGGTWFNADVPTGDFRPVNLTAAPFRFPKPMAWIDDSAVAPQRVLGLWPVDGLRI
jgi:hypothetical protein